MEKIGSPPLKDIDKIAGSVTGRRLNFKDEFSYNVSFIEKTFTSKVYVLPGTTNLFGTDWIVQFDLWKIYMNSFYNKVDVSANGKIKKRKNLFLI